MEYYKGSFTKLDRKQLDSSNKTALLTISVGQVVHEGSKFKAALELVNNTFESCTIAVCDTLQRHSLSGISDGASPEQLHNVSLKEGDQWLERNISMIQSTLTIDHKIKRWDDWLLNKKYHHYRDMINALYKSDEDFKTIVLELAHHFVERSSKTLHNVVVEDAVAKSIEYLLEECAAMTIWYDEGYAFDIYPSIRNKAIEYGFSKIKTDLYGKQLFGIGIKFKKSECLSTSSSTFQQIIDILPGHIYWKNSHGKFLGCNNMQANSYGLKHSSSLINKTEANFLKKDLAEQIMLNDQEIIKSGKTKIIEEETFIGNHKKWVLSHKAPLIEDNKVKGVVGISIDISAQKKLERTLMKQTKVLSDALHDNKRFLNNMSHEIRTPVHIISALIRELQENIGRLSMAEVKDFLDNLAQSNTKLHTLLNSLLDLAKSAQGQSTYEIKPYNIVDSVKQSIQNLSSLIQVELQTEHSKIICDYDNLKLEQVLSNILNNARRYGDGSSIVLKVEVDKQKRVTVSIQNSNSYIETSDLQRIFEPFYQCKAHRQGSGGTGLGLAISKEIIVHHGGYIWAESRDNKVSIKFHLPLSNSMEGK